MGSQRIGTAGEVYKRMDRRDGDCREMDRQEGCGAFGYGVDRKEIAGKATGRAERQNRDRSRRRGVESSEG